MGRSQAIEFLETTLAGGVERCLKTADTSFPIQVGRPEQLV